MGRAPCCEKMGLNKGPWTPEEDRVLVAHIQRFGHGNWRALPKQAGLLRCGKSCRLRWINYLRPDIKRGNFTKEEEDAIIQLHQQLGNRWSAIAAKLPGRTDNEIKNVWHTHLKKRLEPIKHKQDHAPAAAAASKKKQKAAAAPKRGGARKVPEEVPVAAAPVSPERSVSSSVTDSSSMTHPGGNTGSSDEFAKEESFTSSGEFQIDETFWSETLSMPLESFDIPMDSLDDVPMMATSSSTSSGGADDMDFWLRVFMDTDDVQELPQI